VDCRFIPGGRTAVTLTRGGGVRVAAEVARLPAEGTLDAVAQVRVAAVQASLNR